MSTARRPSRCSPAPTWAESTFVGDLLRQETVGGAVVLVAAVVAVVWANSPSATPTSRVPAPADRPARPRAVGRRRRADRLLLRRRARAQAGVPGRLAAPARRRAGADRRRARRRRRLRPWSTPWSTCVGDGGPAAGRSRRRPTSRSRSRCWPWSGPRCRRPLRAFLLTLAVVDDLVVIIIIAVFYTSSLHLLPLLAAAVLLAVYAVLQQRRVTYVRGLRAAGGRLLVVRARERHPRHDRRGRRSACSPGCGPTRTRRTRRPSGSSTGSPRVGRGRRAVLRAAVGRRGDRRRRTADHRPGGDRRGARPGGRQAGRRADSGPGPSPGSPAPSSTRTCPGATSSGVAVLAGVGFTVALLVSDLSFPRGEADAAKTAVLFGSVLAACLAAVVLRPTQPRARPRLSRGPTTTARFVPGSLGAPRRHS